MKKLSVVLIWILILGCEDSTDVNKALLKETPVIVDGDWTIGKVYQNEVDITDNFDFSSFSLTLNYSGENPTTFSISSTNKIPFVTAQTEGNWAFDNIIYPSKMHFIQGDTATGIIAESLFSEDNSKIVVEFSMGCEDNIYAYHMIKSE